MASWLYDSTELRKTPSILDGIDFNCESRYRREGARFIMNVGTKMGLLYDTMGTAVVYFHRFYMVHSFKRFARYPTACCCLFLSGKVEETPKKCKDLIKIVKAILTESQFAEFSDTPEEHIIVLERILLKTIKFDLQIEHPYKYLLSYAKCLIGDKTNLQKMVQMAWTFINDSLCTTLCLQWEPEIIAIALMYLAGKLSKFEIVDWFGRTSSHQYWWDMYVEGMNITIVEDICHQILDLYSTPANSSSDSSPMRSSVCTTQQAQCASLLTSPPTPPDLPPKPKEIVGQPIPRICPLGYETAKKMKSGSKPSREPPSACSFQGLPEFSSDSEKESSAVDSEKNVHVSRSIETVGQFNESCPKEKNAMSPSVISSLSSAATSGKQVYSYDIEEFILTDPGATYFSKGSSFLSPAAQYKMDSDNFVTSQILPSAECGAPFQSAYTGSSPPPPQMHPTFPGQASQYLPRPPPTNAMTRMLPPRAAISTNMMLLSSNERMPVLWRSSRARFSQRISSLSLRMPPRSGSEPYHVGEQAAMNHPPESRAPMTGGRGGNYLWDGSYQGHIRPRFSIRGHQMAEYPKGEYSNNESGTSNTSCIRPNSRIHARGSTAPHMETPTGIPSVRITGRQSPYQMPNLWWEDY